MSKIVFLDYEIVLISLIVFLIEIGILISLLIGWYLGARRLNINLHHYMVYSVTTIHFIIFITWMLPNALSALEFVLNDPIGRALPLLHWSIGLIAVSLSVTIVIIFLFNRDIPLSLLKRVRPLMIVTIICWSIAFVLGLLIFFTFKVTQTEPSYYIRLFF